MLRRSDNWVLGPQADYERVGDVNKVVFPNGWVVDEETGTLFLYYGAGDSVVALATASLSEVLDHVGPNASATASSRLRLARVEPAGSPRQRNR